MPQPARQHAVTTVERQRHGNDHRRRRAVQRLGHELLLLRRAASPTNPIYETSYADKFIEENWIDQNGTALLVNPFNGSLIKAK